MRKSSIDALSIFLALALAGCDFFTPDVPHFVSYDGNGNTSGTAPAGDDDCYEDETIEVADNYGGLAKTGYPSLFAGWATERAGGGKVYAPGNAFGMPDEDVILYARWVASDYVFAPGSGTISLFNFWDRSVDIPAQIDGAAVKKISAKAFYWRRITAVTIPAGVTSIGADAFRNNLLTKILIPDSVIALGDRAFEYNKINTAEISANLASIPDSAFHSNELTSVTIPASVASIGESAFSSNSLTGIDIPAKVRAIGDYAFSGNDITSLAIPGTVTLMGDGVFSSNRLTTITLPSEMTVIRVNTFRKNDLGSVTIPDSVRTIEDMAFAENPITTFTIGGSVAIKNSYGYGLSTMGYNGDSFLSYYNANGKSAGTYKYAGGAWSK